MARKLPVHARKRSWLSLLVALLATTAQLTVALAPLAEGRDSRMASHVEAGGSSSHYAHDDARCVSCQARSMHSDVAHVAAPALPVLRAAKAVGARTTRVALDERGRTDNPRAPPAIQV